MHERSAFRPLETQPRDTRVYLRQERARLDRPAPPARGWLRRLLDAPRPPPSAPASRGWLRGE